MVGIELLMMLHLTIHNFDTNLHEPEVFFNQLFDDRMFTIIAEETNNYALFVNQVGSGFYSLIPSKPNKFHIKLFMVSEHYQQIVRIMGRRDEIQQLEHYSHKTHTRLGMWRDINEADIKIFITRILIMSSLRKSALYNYWSTNTLSRTPFFGMYLSRNKFQYILWNLHVADTNNNPPSGMPNHDPLAKVRPLVTMCQNNFRLRYTPSEYLGAG